LQSFRAFVDDLGDEGELQGAKNMSKKSIVITAALMPFAITSDAFATEYVKEATLSYVGAQATRPIQPSTENKDFISINAGSTWAVNGGSGGITCSDDAAYLPQGNSLMRAIALQAIATNATVQIAVDSTLPTIGNYCVITMLVIKSN
jgi:hypothetical protein